MKKMFQRLLTFIIGVPACFALTWFFTQYNHLLLNLVIVAVSVIATIEIHHLLSQKYKTQSKFFVLVLSVVLTGAGTVCAFFNLPECYISYTLVFCVTAILISEIFCKQEENTPPFSKSIEKILTSLFSIFYVPFLLAFIQRMSVWTYSKENIAVFLLMVFICDSFAWLFGITLGKGNRGLIKVSPNKSIAGFIGGFAGSILIGVAAYYLLPQVFTGSIVKMIVLGFLTALAGILGDLAESILKRSSGIKDSGSIIPGRGGIMDSIDSIVLAAPVYYITANILYNFM